MKAKLNDIAFLVHACDRYELLYKGFEFFFEKNWNFDIDCKYYFATEVIQTEIKGFTNIRSGKGEWADRLAYLLRECIKEPYVMYFQEDMWLNKPVNAAFFNQLFEKVIANKWKQVKLHSSNVYVTEPIGQFIEGFRITKVDNEKSDFLMSHQVTIWEKEYLIQQLKKGEHPWRNERKGTKRLKALNPEIFHIDYFAENGTPAINKNDNPILRSEYQAVSINGMLHGNVPPFITELAASEHLKNYAATLQYNFENGITHDGKPKPRKVDIFKRIKNWIRGKKS